MAANTTPPVFFVSYARNDTDYEPFRKDMKKFIEDLSARVAVKMAVSRAGITFSMNPASRLEQFGEASFRRL